MAKIFIDGSAGTTGLRIYERLSARNDVELITLTEEKRKDTEARRDALNRADIAFLCLPDNAAREAVTLVDNKKTVIIDTSTAHRTEEGWEYGFPELCSRRERIASSKRIANPGCHASGFIALTEPLIRNSVIGKDTLLVSVSLTGYSGGGKKMIAEYEDRERDPLLDAPRMYGLTQEHKHLKEMASICGLSTPPVFTPIVAPYYSGMEVIVSLFKRDVNGGIAEIEQVYEEYYKNSIIRFQKNVSENGFMSASAFSGRDDMQISVLGNDDRIVLCARFDNLGKGASGAAIQNMNIVLGINELTGLNV